MPERKKSTYPSPERKRGALRKIADKKQVRQVGRVGRALEEGVDVLTRTKKFISRYIDLPDSYALVVAAWILAAHSSDVWDRFPHLVITSPEKRCGKTLLLKLLHQLCPRSYLTPNISASALYRLVDKETPTLLVDESQPIVRLGSEMSKILRELLNSAIDKEAKVLRCGGKNFEKVQAFSIYCPKVFALIGQVDDVLADRCLPIALSRKGQDAEVQKYRSHIAKEDSRTLAKSLEEWSENNKDAIAETYAGIEAFHLENDRLSELMEPLQVIGALANRKYLETLKTYAVKIDRESAENPTPGIMLLTAFRQIFEDFPKPRITFKKAKKGLRPVVKKGRCPGVEFIGTCGVIELLVDREEEPWGRWCHGRAITPDKLAGLLRPYGIRPSHDKNKMARGYYRVDFQTAFDAYLPLPPQLVRPVQVVQ